MSKSKEDLPRQENSLKHLSEGNLNRRKKKVSLRLSYQLEGLSGTILIHIFSSQPEPTLDRVVVLLSGDAPRGGGRGVLL